MTEPLPEGTQGLVESALEDAAQTLFSVADVPLARTEEILSALRGPAVRSVLEVRVEQMVKHGHTAEHDAMLPIGWLPNEARQTILAATDVLCGIQERRDLKVGRRRLVKAAAMLLAAIDRLDAANPAERGGQ